ncbi:MAG: ATP-dependent 6-phosphofructokinase [Synechococcales cyanobacterium CRU_2_2]|nr:ATP-dependent 6-phosphofructokinase [Synechococcales cyanobacterium CRU_2_2]
MNPRVFRSIARSLDGQPLGPDATPSATRRIGVLTSGGDCAGLNAAIRAIVHRAIVTYQWEVVGIEQSTHGLMTHPPKVRQLRLEDVDGILTAGGTILGTANYGTPFAYPQPDGTVKDVTETILESYQKLGLSALIGIGGDGSLSILRKLALQGNIPFVGIPKTIDNDVGITERSIGFSTAVNIATEAIDRLHFTAASHSRVILVEVMGRDAGHIAISAGIAGGADVILIPEIPYQLDKIAEKINHNQALGKNYSLVVVAEAVRNEDKEAVVNSSAGQGQGRLGGIGQVLAERISEVTGADTRVIVLGHLQRGGTPSPFDRLTASAFGVAAVDLVAQECYDRMVTWQDRQVKDVPLAIAIQDYAAVDLDGTLVKTARGLGICLGD